MCQLYLLNMSTCTLLRSAWASAEGWWCLCCTSHICDAQLGFAVRQLGEPQLHHFLPGEEGNWKEGDSGKSHTWEAGVCETLKQGAVCCLTGTNKSCPSAQGKRRGSWSGLSWSCWLSLFSSLETLSLLLTAQCWYSWLAHGKYTARAGDPGILEPIQK